jgi:hypothetical protein
MEKLKKAIKNVYGDVVETALTPETRLGDLPGWDSMSAINLEMEIEAVVGKENIGLGLKPDMTLEGVRLLMQKHLGA